MGQEEEEKNKIHYFQLEFTDGREKLELSRGWIGGGEIEEYYPYLKVVVKKTAQGNHWSEYIMHIYETHIHFKAGKITHTQPILTLFETESMHFLALYTYICNRHFWWEKCLCAYVYIQYSCVHTYTEYLPRPINDSHIFNPFPSHLLNG